MFKSIRLAEKTPRGSAVVVGLFSESKKLPAKLPGVHAQVMRELAAALRTPGFKAEPGETFITASGHALVGLGKIEELTADQLRIIAARLLKRLDRTRAKAAMLQMAAAMTAKSIDAITAGRAFGEGMGLANWRVDFFAGKASNVKPANPPLSIASPDARFRQGFADGLALAEAANEARRLAATPPNICTPAWLANEARKIARATGMRCRVIDFSQAQRHGMGGIVNVGIGSANKPCLIIIEHRPAKLARSAKNAHIALVGKSITYDTGGYSLKINNTMKGMKYDKCGGCAVLAAMGAIARRRLPVRVTGLLPAAENMVSEQSYRPDDIITMHNGVSVEVTNTDAEGRLVLADALSYACRDLKVTTIVDLATLTGGIVTALGHFCAGVFCNDPPLLERINAAAKASGEKVWSMPLWKEHKDFMRAQHADILNSNPSRNAHPIQGAAFLAYFVDDKIPWAHIDIAGVSNTEKDLDCYVTGPTGWGARLLVDLVRGMG